MAKTTSQTRRRGGANPYGGFPLRFEERRVADLTPHPGNWRLHPESQRVALRAMLERTGHAGALLFNETTGRLIDGHLRREQALAAEGPDALLPVVVVAVSAEVESRLLAGVDGLIGMAGVDAAGLSSLLDELELGGGLVELERSLAVLLGEASGEGGSNGGREGPESDPSVGAGGESGGGQDEDRRGDGFGDRQDAVVPRMCRLVGGCGGELEALEAAEELRAQGFGRVWVRSTPTEAAGSGAVG